MGCAIHSIDEVITGKYENRIKMHNYIAGKYGWDVVLPKFYNKMKNAYYSE